MSNEDPIIQSLDEMYQKRLHAMNFEKAKKSIRAAAEVLGDNDYIAAEYELNLIANWLDRQLEPDDKVSAVKGSIIGALAGGHIDGRDGASYCKAVLAGIADILDIEIPAEIKRANGLH